MTKITVLIGYEIKIGDYWWTRLKLNTKTVIGMRLMVLNMEHSLAGKQRIAFLRRENCWVPLRRRKETVGVHATADRQIISERLPDCTGSVLAYCAY